MNENMNADMNMAAAAVEIRELHAFFVTWFTGRDENSETVFQANFDARFADGFQLVEPSGRLLGLGDLRGGVLGGHGASPDFRIASRNVIPRPVSADHILATYEEWQIGATNSTPPDNGRAATVLFRLNDDAPNGLLWCHVHETWLPSNVMAAGPYDF